MVAGFSGLLGVENSVDLEGLGLLFGIGIGLSEWCKGELSSEDIVQKTGCIQDFVVYF